jgi:hypothetical protein
MADPENELPAKSEETDAKSPEKPRDGLFGIFHDEPRLVACYGRILVRSPPCPVWQVGEGGSPALDAVAIMTELW